jgi:hypothetical protein
MKSHPANPNRNTVPAGITESELIRAISCSGYPLQGIVASALLPQFNVIEEWGFIDDESKEHRSLDLYAYRPLSPESETTCHCGLMLLIECKRSTHPFVFFQQVVSSVAPRFPSVHGIPNAVISIHEEGNGRLIEASPAMALGLDSLPFVADGPPLCASFSKATPSGKKAELSGTEPFNTIILPLVRALRYAVAQARSPQQDAAIFPTLTMCIAVLDAPMLVVESPQKAEDPVLRPWVRVVRHESSSDRTGSSRSRFYAIDFVHADYLANFLAGHLLPFSEQFATLAARGEDVLRYGGQVPNLEHWSPEAVVPRQRRAR